MSKFNLLTVKEIHRETPLAVSIVFDIPAHLKGDYHYIAGQYINIKFDFNGKEIRRAYSICSSSEGQVLKIVVKKAENGAFSSFANDTLKIGDQLLVEPPQGRFIHIPDTNNSKNYAGFAAGSGITPVIGILKTILEQEPNSTFVLVYGNKDSENTIFHKELHLLQEKYLERFHVHFIFSQEKQEMALFGRIDKAATNFVLNNKHKDVQFEDFFICGPEDMIDIVGATLKEKKYPKEKIHFEIFTPNKDGINPVEISGGMVKVTTLVDDEETTFEMPKSEVLLTGVLKQGIDAPYSCQGGICSSCMCRIVEGSAVMKKNSILSDEEIEDGIILSCQAIVTSDAIYIDYDQI